MLTAQYNHHRPLKTFLHSPPKGENIQKSSPSDQISITVNEGEEVESCWTSDADFLENLGELNHSPTSPFEKYPPNMPKSASTSLLFDSVRISQGFSSTPPPKPPYRAKNGHKGPPPPPPPRIDSLLQRLPVAPKLMHNGDVKANVVTFKVEHVSSFSSSNTIKPNIAYLSRYFLHHYNPFLLPICLSIGNISSYVLQTF